MVINQNLYITFLAGLWAPRGYQRRLWRLPEHRLEDKPCAIKVKSVGEEPITLTFADKQHESTFRIICAGVKHIILL